MIISIVADKNFDIQFNTHYDKKKKKKSSPESGHTSHLNIIKGIHLNIIKAIFDKSTCNIIFNHEKLKSFPLRLKTRLGCPLWPLLFYIVSKFQPQQSEKEKIKIKKRLQTGKEVKLSLFVYDLILYKGNPSDATRKLLELIDIFGNVSG